MNEDSPAARNAQRESNWLAKQAAKQAEQRESERQPIAGEGIEVHGTMITAKNTGSGDSFPVHEYLIEENGYPYLARIPTQSFIEL
jgi:hypothetical protein